MLVEIHKETLDNKDVRQAIITLRKHEMKTFRDGYYHAFITEKQRESLLADPKIMNVHYVDPGLKSAIQPAVYGAKFYTITHEDQPARFYGTTTNEEYELEEVNV